MADWYYAKNGQQKGPINSAELKRMAQAGEIGPDDLVFREGGTNWVAASTVAGLFPAGGVSTAPRPAAREDDEPPRRRRDRDEDVGELPTDDDDRPRRRRSSGEGGFGDILMFRTFVAPWVAIILFWMGVLGVFLYAGGMGLWGLSLLQFNAFGGLMLLVLALLIIPFGVLYVRILAEMMIVIFRIHETLKDIKQELEKRN